MTDDELRAKINENSTHRHTVNCYHAGSTTCTVNDWWQDMAPVEMGKLLDGLAELERDYVGLMNAVETIAIAVAERRG